MASPPIVAAFRVGKHIRELRLHLCQKSHASKGTRDFIEKYYVPIKKENPKFPILIRECSNVQPKLFARYEFGKESSLSLNNLTAEQVLESVQKIAK